MISKLTLLQIEIANIGDIYSVDYFLYVAVNKYLYKYSVH